MTTELEDSDASVAYLSFATGDVDRVTVGLFFRFSLMGKDFYAQCIFSLLIIDII